MTKTEQLRILESRQLQLLCIMSRSDAHASKCFKLGKNFETEYPEEKAEYTIANEEYNRNETTMELLKAEIEAEIAEKTKQINKNEIITE